jgi:hypothetical protein
MISISLLTGNDEKSKLMLLKRERGDCKLIVGDFEETSRSNESVAVQQLERRV